MNKLVGLLATLSVVSSFPTDDIEFSPNLCNAPTCEYFQNFVREVTMMYTDDDGVPRKALATEQGKVVIPELDNMIVPPEEFISHGLIVLDGFSRIVHAVNHMVPSPTIEVFQDTEIIVHFINLNDGAQGLGIHWHGMYQTTTPWQDGVGGITQCHINPGTTWTYKFRADPWGSFWYHSHSGFNRDDGLYGAMIIHEREVPDQIPRYQHDHFFSHITEWFHDEAEEHWIKRLTQQDILLGRNLGVEDDSTESSIIFTGGLIGNNEIDLGQWWNATGDGREPITPGDHFNTVDDVQKGFLYNTFNVVQGDTYRFRFIGAAFNTIVRISFDNHLVTLISQDAFDIAPVRDVESILILPGERYDVLLTANQPVGNYWMRTLHAVGFDFDSVQHEVRAVLHYDGAHDPADDDFDPWRGDTAITSRRDVCTSEAPCHIGNCFQLEYFPPVMVDGANEDCQDHGACVGNGAITRCTHPGDNVNIDNYDATRLAQFAEIGNDGTYVDVGLPTQRVADAIHFLGFGFDRFINGIKWRANSEPLGFNFVIPDPDNICPTDSNGDQFCPAMNCHCTHIVELEWNSVTDIVWFNIHKDVTQCGSNPCDPLTLQPDANSRECGSPDSQEDCASETSHPIHLHGHAFWILFEGKALLNTTTGWPINNAYIQCDDDGCFEPHYRNGVLPPLNFRNPPQKDTLPVPPGGFAHVRIRTNNPGAWPNHCHLENHLPTMMLEWHENHSGDFNDPKNFDVNRPPTLPRCGNFDPDAPNGIGPVNPTTIPGETAVPMRDMSVSASFHKNNALLPLVFVLAGLTLVFFGLFLWSCSQLQNDDPACDTCDMSAKGRARRTEERENRAVAAEYAQIRL